jgi:RNase P subunit RPR2
MAERRYCQRCSKEVVCQEQREDLASSHNPKVTLICPSCGKQFGIMYSPRGVEPVKRARIAQE